MQKSAYANGDYGIDAPPVIRNLLVAGVASIITAIVLKYLLATTQAMVGMILLIWGKGLRFIQKPPGLRCMSTTDLRVKRKP